MREQAEWALSYLARNGLHLRVGLKKLGYSGDSSTIPEDATIEVTCKIKGAKGWPGCRFHKGDESDRVRREHLISRHSITQLQTHRRRDLR